MAPHSLPTMWACEAVMADSCGRRWVTIEMRFAAVPVGVKWMVTSGALRRV